MQRKLIVIDGPSCAGKTHLAHALQARMLPEVWLNFSIDTVVYTLPSAILSECNDHNNWEDVDIKAMIHGAFLCVNSLLGAGNHVIFDVVISSQKRAEELQEFFSKNDVFYVGLTAQWECLVQRVHTRQDRTLGEVEHGYRTSPKHLPYDLRVDTTHHDPATVADMVWSSMCEQTFLEHE